MRTAPTLNLLESIFRQRADLLSGRTATRLTGAAWQKRSSKFTMRPKKTILCVDHNEQILSVRTFLLETRGYRVIAVTTPREALEVVERAPQGSIDLLLAEIVLPQMDGNELVRRAKQRQPALPAMLVSGTVTSADRASSADAFLPKGACSPVAMLERIRVLVARKRGPKKAILAPQLAELQAAS